MNISLNGRWEFCGKTRKRKHLPVVPNTWLPARVPGDVHLDLVANGLLPEPLEDRNIEKAHAIEGYVWHYRKIFRFRRPRVGFRSRLVFEGLDCIAKIFLNGSLVGGTDNAFVEHIFDVSSHVQDGENVLEVELTNGLETIPGKKLKRYLADKPEFHRVWLRKAQFSFGWDWAPRLIPCGIWRGVHLEMTTEGFIDNVFARPVLRHDNRQAVVHCSFNYTPVHAKAKSSPAVVKIIDPAGRVVTETKIRLRAGEIKTRLIIDKPQLWWPAGEGSQPLYTLDIQAVDSEKTRAAVRFGVRRVRLIEKALKEGGSTFAFEINGKKLFCRGANWVPADSIPARVTDEKINTLLEEAVRCNFNMLRIWGGGIYESNYFYSRCDELGIMLWQDFMYACALYPDDDKHFFANCASEATKAVKRLRNHPAIVLWCGNNEIHDGYEDVYQYQGAKRLYGSKLWDDYLPAMLKTEYPGALYRPASPYGGEYSRSELAGDCHCLRACLTKEEHLDIRLRTKAVGRFVSEFYTWTSPPDIHSIIRYLPPDQRHPDSEDYKLHANDVYEGSELAVARAFVTATPEKLPLDVYSELMQRLQAQHMAALTETYRRNSDVCSGAMFWMYNDCWPVSSWTTHDYYLRRKALYYYMKRAFAPLSISFKEENSALSVWVGNLGRETFRGQVRYGRYGFHDGTAKGQWSHRVAINPGQSQNVGIFNTTLTWPFENLSSFAYATLKDQQGNLRASTTHLFSSYKGYSGEEFMFPPSFWAHKSIQKPKVSIKQAGKNAVVITTNVPTFSLRLHADDLLPEDNYIDVMPGECRRIRFTKPIPMKKINVTTLNDLIVYLRK